MDVSAINNNSIDIQSLIINNINGASRANNKNDTTNKTADYAKKGEPMYMEEMDTDKDGTVTLDEFREYCKSKGINSKEMVQMSKMASTFRTMQAEEETINYISKLTPNISPKLKESSNNSVHVKTEENKYNISNDKNHDNKVSYNEYMKFCEQNVDNSQLKTKATFEEKANGNFKISNMGKAVQSYRNNEEHTVKNTFENVV